MRMRLILVTLVLACAGSAPAQERFSIFVPSDQENVERMLKLAELREGDVVVDLGSGDGRVVLSAARMNPGVTGWGVDIDPKLVAESNAEAKKQGLAGRVRFIHENAFDTDLSKASVIAMWFWPEMQRLLRPVILARARPGTRVITNIWDLGSWPPDRVDTNGSPVSMWVVPARVAGYWNWDLRIGKRAVSYSAIVEQRFQAIEGAVRTGIRRELFQDPKLNGENISFGLSLTIDGLGFTRHEFRGKVRDGVVEGTVRVSLPPHETSMELPWRAIRSETTTYFAPTGTNIPASQ